MPGTWSFTASKSGYNTNSWSQDITSTSTKHAYLIKQTEIGRVILTQAVHITPSGPYSVGHTLTATFTVKNVGGAAITLDKLLLGGRFNGGKLPSGAYPDFTSQYVTLQPGQSHQYQGSLVLTEPGNYHFFCAYHTPDGDWNTSIDLAPTLNDNDRIKDIVVEFPGGAYISRITPDFGVAGEEVTITGVNFNEVLEKVKNVIFKETGMLGDVGSAEIVSSSDRQIVCRVPVLAPVSKGSTVEVALGDWNDNPVSNSVEFTYKKPVLDDLNPRFGGVGTKVTLFGQNFGYEQVGVSPPGSWVSAPRSYVTFGATRIDEVVPPWANDKIVVKAPSDFGTGLGDAKRVLDALTLIMRLANEGVKGAIKFLIEELFDKALPQVQVEWELKEDGSLVLQFFETTGAIGIEAIPVVSIFVDVNLIADFDLPVTVTTTGGTSEPLLFRFTKDLSQIDIEDSLIAHLASPGELRIYDSQNRVTGLVEGELKEEIPDSLSAGNTVLIFNATDSYRYEVVGTDEGRYGLNVASIREGKVTSVEVTDAATSERAVHRYTINWDALRRGEPSIGVQIDSDGDKVFEETKILQPPTASFVFSPISAVTDEEIGFDASESRDVDGEIVSYKWNFGDGTASTGRVVKHAYSAAGEYSVTLAVIDNDGLLSTHSRVIQVEPRREGMPIWVWIVGGLIAALATAFSIWRGRASREAPKPNVDAKPDSSNK